MASATVRPQEERRCQSTLSRQPRPVLIAGLFSKNSHSSIRPWPPPGLSVGRVVAEHVGPEDAAGPGPKPETADAELGGSRRAKRLRPAHPPPAAGAAEPPCWVSPVPPATSPASQCRSPGTPGPVQPNAPADLSPWGERPVALQVWTFSPRPRLPSEVQPPRCGKPSRPTRAHSPQEHQGGRLGAFNLLAGLQG